MKIKKLLLVATALLLTACPKEEEVTDNSGNDSTPVEENNNNNQGENTNNGENGNTNNEEVIEYPPIVANSKWGIDAADACYFSIGTVIPYMECDSFEYVEAIDDYGDPAIWFYLYYETSEIAESKLVDYAYVCYEVDQYECVVTPHRFYDEMSYWEQTVLFADKVFNKDKAVEIIALDSIRKEKPCLGLFCTNYIPNMDKSAFPNNAVEHLLGENNELPTLSTVNDELTYDFMFSMVSGLKCLRIVVEAESVSYTLEESYFNELLAAGFTLVQFDELEEAATGKRFLGSNETYPEFEDNLYYYALSPEGDYMLSFDYDLYNNLFVIDIIPEK